MIQVKAALTLLLFLVLMNPAHAKENLLPGGNFSELRSVNSGKVLQVIDPLTVQLDDKRVIRLSGIEYPDYNSYQSGPLSVMALKVLKDMLEGNRVNVHQTKKADWGRSNRMGQQIAHLELQNGSTWVQGALLQLGLARVMTDIRTPEMAAQMYALEEVARAQKNGIWAVDAHKVMTPEQAADHIGQVAIVEGRVHSAAMRQNHIYLNFGPDWRKDFTLTITSKNRRAFFDRNIDPLKWSGKTVRARGYIGSFNGPFIEIDHPERVELLADDNADLPLKDAPQGPMLKSTAKN